MGLSLVPKVKTVIDVGCSPKGADSIGYLAREFLPETLYGFDPSPAVEQIVGSYPIGGTRVIVERKAAWISDGWLHWVPTGYGTVSEDAPEHMTALKVRAFDLAKFIQSLGDDKIHLKMDCEGAEYPILEHLIAKKAIEKVSLLWIEWHYLEADSLQRQEAILAAMPHVDLHSWNM